MKAFLTVLFVSITSWLTAFPLHPPQIAEPLNRIYSLQESRAVLDQVEREGSIKIKIANFGNGCNAAWVSDERTIYLNFANKRTVGSLICSILFELHNALSEKQFDHYDSLAFNGKISKEDYITAIEYIEYCNACKTIQILEQGIHKRVFPSDARWAIAKAFNQHYHIQHCTGHSALIGDMYDQLRGHQNGGFKRETR